MKRRLAWLLALSLTLASVPVTGAAAAENTAVGTEVVTETVQEETGADAAEETTVADPTVEDEGETVVDVTAAGTENQEVTTENNEDATEAATTEVSGEGNTTGAVSTEVAAVVEPGTGEGLVVTDPVVEAETLAKGSWRQNQGKWYYVNEDGSNYTGWLFLNGRKYYLDENGVMQTGIQEIKGKKYYFYPGGTMAVDITLAVGTKEYTINSQGVVTAEKTIKVSGNTTGANIAKFALKFVGNRYVYGGTSLTNGADCSGFVMSVFANFGIKLLRVANDQMYGPGAGYIAQGYKKAVVVNANSMQPGDLLFYGSGGYASHVAIYIGDGKIVHASNSQPYPAGGIKISPYNYNTVIRIVRYWS